MTEFIIMLILIFFVLFFVVFLLLPPLHKDEVDEGVASGNRDEQGEPVNAAKAEEQYFLGPYGCVSLLAGLFIGFIAGVVGTILWAKSFF